MISRVLLLGASGDLAGRFLLPALARLVASAQLPRDLRVVGAAPQNWDDERFRDHVAQRLRDHAPDLTDDVRQAFVERLRYRRVDLEDQLSVRAAVQGLSDPAPEPTSSQPPVAAYLALPPALFASAIRALSGVGLPPGSRIAVEKPFGEDRAGAVSLNALLSTVSQVGGQQAVFRVDHALGMPAAADLLALRTRGRWAPVWNGSHIDQVDILWEETLALEGRASFYDRTGAVRDVLQNHMIQILALVAMDLPGSPDDKALHDAKLELLRAVAPIPSAELSSRTRRARYGAGTLAVTGAATTGYAQQDGVDPARTSETYAELVLQVDRPLWAGTRFVLRAGKALASDRKGILIHFRSQTLPPDVREALPRSGRLWIPIDAPLALDHAPAISGETDTDVATPAVDGELLAYEQVLLDVLTGSARLSVSGEESEQAWRIVEPVLKGWAEGGVPMAEYPAGSQGPEHLAGVING